MVVVVHLIEHGAQNGAAGLLDLLFHVQQLPTAHIVVMHSDQGSITCLGDLGYINDHAHRRCVHNDVICHSGHIGVGVVQIQVADDLFVDFPHFKNLDVIERHHDVVFVCSSG